jgi:hypothetical protein
VRWKKPHQQQKTRVYKLSIRNGEDGVCWYADRVLLDALSIYVRTQSKFFTPSHHMELPSWMTPLEVEDWLRFLQWKKWPKTLSRRMQLLHTLKNLGCAQPTSIGSELHSKSGAVYYQNYRLIVLCPSPSKQVMEWPLVPGAVLELTQPNLRELLGITRLAVLRFTYNVQERRFEISSPRLHMKKVYALRHVEDSWNTILCLDAKILALYSKVMKRY